MPFLRSSGRSFLQLVAINMTSLQGLKAKARKQSKTSKVFLTKINTIGNNIPAAFLFAGPPGLAALFKPLLFNFGRSRMIFKISGAKVVQVVQWCTPETMHHLANFSVNSVVRYS
jgi:hypothetical protein